MPFEPGHSGNPGGRPKGLTQVRELARAHTEAAIAALVKIMQKENVYPFQGRGWLPPHLAYCTDGG